MGKFNKGLFLGGLLGAGLTWLNTTKKGKATRDEIVQHASDVYPKIVAEIKQSKQWKQLSKSEYVERVQAFIDTYAVETGLSDKMKMVLEKLVVSQWKRFKAEQQDDTSSDA